jgi:hypothetical protein
MLLERGNARLSIALSPHALEAERTGNYADSKSANLAGALSHYRSSACACTAAHTGSDKNHIRAPESLKDIITALLGRFLTDLGLCASSQAAGQLLANLHALGCQRFQERLSIRIDGDELYALKSQINHAVHSIAAATAYTYYLNVGQLVQAVIIQLKHHSNPHTNQYVHALPGAHLNHYTIYALPFYHH